MGSVISQLHLSNVTLLLLGVLLAGNDVTDAEAVTSSQSNTSSSPSCSCIGSIITSVVATCVGTALICIITAFLLHRHHIRKTNSARDLIVQGETSNCLRQNCLILYKFWCMVCTEVIGISLHVCILFRSQPKGFLILLLNFSDGHTGS